jgi:hypothetical protein
MAKQLSQAEREEARRLAGGRTTPLEIWKKLKAARSKCKVAPPDLTSVRRFLKGKTHRQDIEENRGRTPTFTRRNVLKMDKVRKELIAKSDGEWEVHWEDVMKKARVPKADFTTVARSFSREDLSVEWRTPREKPLRGPEHIDERREACRQWRHRRNDYFTDTVDLIMDNTTWNVPATVRARKYLNQRKVRGHLRTRSEGLQTGFTKPSGKKHNMNTGAKLKLVAGVSNCKIVLWHYLDGPWNGEAPASVYRGPITKILKSKRGDKKTYVVLEDNDPVGYKSNKAIQAKKENGIVAMHFPRYSPDLNPLDYFVWQEVESRMAKNTPKKLESVDAFKQRLRRTALAVPEAVIRKGLENMKKRIQNCYENGGRFVTWD